METNDQKIKDHKKHYGQDVEKNSFFDRRHRRINIDLSHRCPLECLRCGRQTSYVHKGLKVPGRDLTIEEFEKLTDHYKCISFCGTYSDPIHHPKFKELLEISNRKKVRVEVHVASSLKPKKAYIEAFKAYPNADWLFGIDGLPEESHKYRKNQDGQKLFEIMLESKKHLNTKPLWQFIIFSYNEHSLDNAMQMAKDNEVDFVVVNSARWIAEDDWLKPKSKREMTNE